MKKRLAGLIAAAMIISILAPAAVAATYSVDPRWSYMSTVFRGIEMTDEGISWYATADTYRVPKVTHTEVVAKLQANSIAGWGTLETLSDKRAASSAGVGSVRASWVADRSYRIEVYAYAYSGDTVIESVGPLYDYLNT